MLEELEESEETPAEILKEYDVDGDGKLSLEEISGNGDDPEDQQFQEMTKVAFKKADADGDNLVDAKEVEVLMQILKG